MEELQCGGTMHHGIMNPYRNGMEIMKDFHIRVDKVSKQVSLL